MSPREANRREFLKKGAALGGVAFITQPQRLFGANDRVRVAVCGIRSRGFDHVKNFAKLANVQIAAVCDIDENVLRQRVAEMEKMGLQRPATYTDYRKLLEDQSIDAVSLATPNHWHALQGIWACQAGKDAYIEKPCSHNLWEGRQLVEAARKYNRMVQHGTQLRSMSAARAGISRLRDGLLGDVYMARGLCFKWRDTIGRAARAPVPPGVHYDLWTGPAPLHEFTKNRFHYNWHWFWDTGNGDLGNQGVHQVDAARWGLGVTFPTKVSAIGGHFMFDDDQETPNDLGCLFEFDGPGGRRRMISFEVRHWISNHETGLGTPALGTPEPPQATPDRPRLGPQAGTRNSIGNVFYGAQGYLALGDEDAATWVTWLGRDQQTGPTAHAGGELDHFRNFIACVVSRKKEDLNAPIEEGHISCALVHLANASYRLGRTIHFNPQTEQVIGDQEAELLLADGRRGYRAPFVVPERV